MLVAAVCLIIMVVAAMFAVWGSGSRGPGRTATVVIRAERAVSQANRALVNRANVFALDEYRMARTTRRPSRRGIAS